MIINVFEKIDITKGYITLNGHQLHAGDGVRVCDEKELKLSDGKNAEVLVFDMRANELPEF